MVGEKLTIRLNRNKRAPSTQNPAPLDIYLDGRRHETPKGLYTPPSKQTSSENPPIPEQAAEAPPKNKAPSMASRVAGAKHGFSYGMERGAQGVLGVAEGVTDFIATPVYNTVSAVTSLGGLAKNPVSNFFSQQAQNLLTESPTRAYGESIERRYNPDKGMRFAGDIVETVSGMLPAIGAGVGAGAAAKGITEGAKLAAKVAPHIGKAIMGMQAAGGGAQEAYQEGAGMGKSVVYGLGKGVLETATESIAGAIPGMPKGYISEITEKVVASPLARSLIDIAGEGGEEALSEILTPFLKRAVYAPYAKTASVDEIANAALMGMIAAGVIQGGTGNIDLRLTNKPPQTAANAPTAAANTTSQQQVHTPAEPTPIQSTPYTATPAEAQGEDLQAAGAQDIPAVQTEGIDKLAALEQERKIKASNMAYIYADYKMSTEDTLRPEIFSEYNAAKKELSEIDAEIYKEKAMLQEKEKADSEARKASQTKQSVINILEAEKNLFISDEAVKEISATGLYAEETKKVIAFKKQAAKQTEEINSLLYQLNNAKSLDKKAEIDDKIRATDFLLNKSVEKLQQAQDALKIRAQKEVSQGSVNNATSSQPFGENTIGEVNQQPTTPSVAFKLATPLQEQLNTTLAEIASDLGVQYIPTDQKSIESMERKINRKGKWYDVLDMKDHARSKLELDDFSQIPQVLELLGKKNIPYQTEAIGPTEWGYQGFHVTYRDTHGLGAEIQLTRPDVWRVKLESDKIYKKWRDVDKTTLSPSDFAERESDLHYSNQMWEKLNLPDFTSFTTSVGESNLPSAVSQPYKGERAFTQAPSINSKSGLPNAFGDVSISRPASVNTNAIKAPPYGSIIAENTNLVKTASGAPPFAENTVSAAKPESNLNFVNQDVMNAADTIGQTVKQTARTAYQQVVSGQAPIERLSKANAADNPDIDAATQMARQAGGIVDSIAEDALVSKDFKKIGISYTKLMKKIPKENLAEFNDYAQNLHNINRMSLEDNAIQAVNQFELSHPQVVGTPINTLEEMAKSNDDSAVLAREYLRLITKAKETKNKPVFGELIERITPSGKVVQELGGRTAEQSRQIVKDYEAAHPKYREIMNEIEAWWDKFGQSWYVDTGLVSKKSYDAMREMYPNYIPTHREEKQNTFGRGLFGKSVSTPKVIGAATGGAGKIIPLEESFMAQIDRTVKAAQRNEVYKTLLKAAETDPETAALHGVAISKKSGGTFDTADIDGFLDQVEKQTIQQLENGGFEVTVLVDGEKVTLDVSKEVGECLRWLEDKGMSESWLKNFIGLGKSLTDPSKTAITGINALFAITNTVKDSQTYFINSISNNPLELVSNYGRAILDVAFKRETYQTYKATGGARSGFYGQQRGFKKSLKTPFSELTPPKKIERFATTLIAAPFKAAAKVGEFTEQIPRVAEFRNAIARYGNTPEGLKRAAYAAADVTTNFSRGAPITKVADAWVLYINPQVQGLDKTARQIKNRPIATLTKASVLSIATLLLALVNRDNPNYDELDNRTKDTYFLLPNEKNLDENGHAKTFYKIPKSREWGAIMSSSFDRIAKYMETQDLAESFRGYGSTFANNLLPSNPITDNILSPVLINLKSNRDFAGRNIVPQSMQNLSPRNQYDITTSGIARAVGERFNLSPKQIDYLIGSYMGYPGVIIQALSSPKNIGRTPEETAMNAIQMAIVQPFERRFTADPLYNSVTIDKLYYAIEQAATDAADKNFEENIPQDVVTPEDKRKSYLTKAAVDIAELRTEEKNILAEFLPIKEKEQKIDEIRRKMNNIAKEAITTVDDYVSAYEKTYVPETSMLGEKMQAAYRDMQNRITPQQFADVYNAQKGIKGDKDRHGKTIYLSASKKKKAAIDTAAKGLPKYVKYDLYDAFGVSEEIW